MQVFDRSQHVARFRGCESDDRDGGMHTARIAREIGDVRGFVHGAIGGERRRNTLTPSIVAVEDERKAAIHKKLAEVSA